ncbi:hypothetical protein CUMW_113890 [Citrus unshiu]|nr:hypothetical protein CUMW_113890 [Citrus unshiu]
MVCLVGIEPESSSHLPSLRRQLSHNRLVIISLCEFVSTMEMGFALRCMTILQQQRQEEITYPICSA